MYNINIIVIYIFAEEYNFEEGKWQSLQKIKIIYRFKQITWLLYTSITINTLSTLLFATFLPSIILLHKPWYLEQTIGCLSDVWILTIYFALYDFFWSFRWQIFIVTFSHVYQIRKFSFRYLEALHLARKLKRALMLVFLTIVSYTILTLFRYIHVFNTIPQYVRFIIIYNLSSLRYLIYITFNLLLL